MALATKYSISLAKIVKNLGLEVVYTPNDLKDILVTSPDVNRPGLLLSGFSKYFDPDRIQFLGITEVEYLNSCKEEERLRKVKRLLSKKPVAVVVTRDLNYTQEFLDLAEKYKVTLLRTSVGTSSCMSSLISYLSVELAPRITRHGVFVEVYGEGVLILGDSGVGKSEIALELIKRGHRPYC